MSSQCQWSSCLLLLMEAILYGMQIEEIMRYTIMSHLMRRAPQSQDKKYLLSLSSNQKIAVMIKQFFNRGYHARTLFLIEKARFL